MKLETIRTDLKGPVAMMSFQQAFVTYLATQGYTDFEYVLTVNPDFSVSCVFSPDLNNVQKADVQTKLETLLSVQLDSNDTGLTYTYTYLS